MKDDTISRQEAIALAKDLCVPTKDGTVYRHRCIDPDAIKELPSAQTSVQLERTKERTKTHVRDLISRAAAIDACTKAKVGAFPYDAGVNNSIKALKALPSAQQWISCSERLPNINGVYNVTRKISDGFECRNISDACYYDGTNTWYDDTKVNHDRRYLTDVIAWMPLPEPYEERRENGNQ